MKRLIFAIAILFCIISVSVEANGPIFIAKKIDNFSIRNERVYLGVGDKPIQYNLTAEGGVVSEGEDDLTVFIKREGEKCHPYYIISRDMFFYLGNFIKFSPSSASSGFCAEAEKTKKQKIKNKTKTI